MSSLSSSRCRRRHVFPVFPIFPNLLGKTCLPHLPLRCWGRHVFPVFPEMLGKLHLLPGMLGKTLGDVGEDKNIGEDTQGCRGGHQGGHWGQRGRHLGTTGTSGKTLGSLNVPDVFLQMSGEGSPICSPECTCCSGGRRGCWGRLSGMTGTMSGMTEDRSTLGTLGDLGEDTRGQGHVVPRASPMSSPASLGDVPNVVQGQHWGGRGRHRGRRG